LVTKTDGKESSIYLKGIERFIQEIWAEMVKDNWKTLRVRQLIPEELDVHYMMLYDYKSGKKTIPIQTLYKLLLLWKKYCRKTNKDVDRKWDEIYRSDFTLSSHKSHSISLPKSITPKLSYLLGWLCGDGHIEDRWNHYLIKISEKSTNQINFVLKPLVKELFNIDAPIFHIYEGGYGLQFGNKPIFRFLAQVLKIKVGKIPELVYKLDKINKKYFLAGIFDAEGDVSKTRNRITISQANLEFINQLIYLFKEFNINFRGPYKHKTNLGIWYTIRLEKQDEVLKFFDYIGIYHIDKLKRLKEKLIKIYENRNCNSSA